VKDMLPISMTNMNGTLYFDASGTSVDLWKSDGTTAGTVMVKDSVSMEPGSLTVVNGTLYFNGYDDVHGYELWKTDGTAAGTGLVKDINPGLGLRPNSNVMYLTKYNGILYFNANDGTNGDELWRSDGTDAGTYMVKDISSGCQTFCGSNPKYLTVANGNLFFSANDGTNGVELWKLGMAAGVERTTSTIPAIATLSRNYPNPFNPSTTIEFSIVRAGFVALHVYNILGKEVAALVHNSLSPGSYKTTWDASGLPSGVYYCRLTSGEVNITRELMLMK